jgi:hypothetical protein
MKAVFASQRTPSCCSSRKKAPSALAMKKGGSRCGKEDAYKAAMSPKSSSGKKRNKSLLGCEFASARKKRRGNNEYDVLSPKKDCFQN